MINKVKIRKNSAHLHILVSPEILNRLKKISEKEEMPVSTLARSWIIEKIKELEK